MRVVILSLALAGVAVATPPAELVKLQKHFHEVIEAAEPSIACILVSRSEQYAHFGQGPSAARDGKLGDFRPRPVVRSMPPAERELLKRLDLANAETVPEAYGSGVVIDDSGLVLTNYHVIADIRGDGKGMATKVYVRLPGLNRGSYADILAADPRADLAVLKMLTRPAELRAIPIGDAAKVRKGDWVIALSNPFAAGFRDGSPSAAPTFIANLRRRVPSSNEERLRAKQQLSEFPTLLQTDARLHLGSSGGALINMDGELIGLTTALAAITGTDTPGGYAIPMDANTKKMIETLKRGEEIEYGFLGVMVNPEEKGAGRGVMIQEAAPGLPAAKAGMLARDIVVSINNNPVREQDDLFLNISAAQAGSEVTIVVERAGRKKELKVRLGKSAAIAEPIVSNRPKPVHGLRVDYATTSIDANPPDGVLVKDLEPGSPAHKKLSADNSQYNRLIVTAVDGQPVPTPADFYRLAGGKRSVELDIDAGPGVARKKVTLP